MRVSMNEKRSPIAPGATSSRPSLGLLGLRLSLQALVQLVLTASVALATVLLVALAHGTPPP